LKLIIELENELAALDLLHKTIEIYGELGEQQAVSYVESSYHLLSKVYHPDKNPKNTEKAKIFQQRLNNLRSLFLKVDRKEFTALLEKRLHSKKRPKKRVLIVEDELSLKEVYRDVLIMEGYDVRVAGDGEEGLQAYREFEPDLVFTDVMMPGLTGPEMAAEIRKTNPEVKVIFISGYMNIQRIKRDLDKDVGKYKYPCLSKPFKISTMLEIIENYLKEKSEIDLYA
jgi:CheY-like chemotaxis protein